MTNAEPRPVCTCPNPDSPFPLPDCPRHRGIPDG
ncbi:MAG: hypothetical protein K0Q93_3039 [Nocardioidaceae bacterium]|nr:hypothetical protein [Nocardioidaceae bacterium]